MDVSGSLLRGSRPWIVSRCSVAGRMHCDAPGCAGVRQARGRHRLPQAQHAALRAGATLQHLCGRPPLHQGGGGLGGGGDARRARGLPTRARRRRARASAFLERSSFGFPCLPAAFSLQAVSWQACHCSEPCSAGSVQLSEPTLSVAGCMLHREASYMT